MEAKSKFEFDIIWKDSGHVTQNESRVKFGELDFIFHGTDD